jgi:hypothetical protein
MEAAMFGKGKMQITLPKTHYLPGEIISGDIKFELKKPVKARQVSVSLIGELKSRRVGSLSGDRYSSSTSTQVVRIYEFEQQLDGEREYSGGGNYHFEMKIPADILSAQSQMPEMEGVLGTGIKIVQAAAAMTGAIPYQQTRWYLAAKLDIPGGMDVSKNADIAIG